MNLVYKEKELQKFVDLWNTGMSVQNIAKEMKRKKLEIALLVIDRAELGKIQGRKTGLDGS